MCRDIADYPRVVLEVLELSVARPGEPAAAGEPVVGRREQEERTAAELIRPGALAEQKGAEHHAGDHDAAGREHGGVRQRREREGGVDREAEQRPARERQADAAPPAEAVKVGDPAAGAGTAARGGRRRRSAAGSCPRGGSPGRR